MKIALIENLGVDFYNARLRFALFLKNKGHDVTAIIPNDGYEKKIEDNGIKVLSVSENIRRNNLHNKKDYFERLVRIIKAEKFDIVHSYRLQPNIIATLVTGLYSKNTLIINHVTGLGIAFSKEDFKSFFYRFTTKFLYQFNNKLFSPITIFQNEHDAKDLGIKKRHFYVPGSAVNEDRFNISRYEVEINKRDIESINFIYISRLIKEKGVLELIEAFKKVIDLTSKKINLKIIGGFDKDNASSLKENQLFELINDVPEIDFLGRRLEVDKYLAFSDVAILPTYYREGTPRFLLEAMAMKKAILTTKVPGCEHLINGAKLNGVLIKPKSSKEIMNGILDILNMDISVLGHNSYTHYKEKFSEEKIYNSIYKIYKNELKEDKK